MTVRDSLQLHARHQARVKEAYPDGVPDGALKTNQMLEPGADARWANGFGYWSWLISSGKDIRCWENCLTASWIESAVPFSVTLTTGIDILIAEYGKKKILYILPV